MTRRAEQNLGRRECAAEAPVLRGLFETQFQTLPGLGRSQKRNGKES